MLYLAYQLFMRPARRREAPQFAEGDSPQQLPVSGDEVDLIIARARAAARRIYQHVGR